MTAGVKAVHLFLDTLTKNNHIDTVLLQHLLSNSLGILLPSFYISRKLNSIIYMLPRSSQFINNVPVHLSPAWANWPLNDYTFFFSLIFLPSYTLAYQRSFWLLYSLTNESSTYREGLNTKVGNKNLMCSEQISSLKVHYNDNCNR